MGNKRKLTKKNVDWVLVSNPIQLKNLITSPNVRGENFHSNLFLESSKCRVDSVLGVKGVMFLIHPSPRWFSSLKVLVCWWKKSFTSWYGKYPIIYRVLYIPGGAGCLPSTVPQNLFAVKMIGKWWDKDYDCLTNRLPISCAEFHQNG